MSKETQAMRFSSKTAMVVVVALALAGCDQMRMANEPGTMAPPAGQGQSGGGDAAHLPRASVTADRNTRSPTAVDSALAWSAKYAKAVENLNLAEKKNRALAKSNRELQKQVTSLQSELTQTKKEVTDANAMLIEMRKDLMHWKKSVWGFREEIREAQRAQLEALHKLLEFIGGEVSPSKARKQPAEREKVSKTKGSTNETVQ